VAEPPRLFRLALDFPTNPSEQELVDIRASFQPLSQENAGEPLIVPHATSLEFNEPRKVVGTVKECIYCHATEYVSGTGERLSAWARVSYSRKQAVESVRSGLKRLKKLLTELIRHDFNSDQPHPDQFHLVGGDLRTFAPHTGRLHTLGWSLFETKSKTYLLVAVRLFSYLGGPIYDAIAGYFTEEQLAKARAVSKAHAQSSR
jgi:hypothetical protein